MRLGFVAPLFIIRVAPVAAASMLVLAACAGDAPGVLSDISPTSGPRGTAVTIRGRAFGSTSAGARVTFNGGAAAIVRWSDTEIEALVPPKASLGMADVRVVRNNAASAASGFRVTDYTPGRGALRGGRSIDSAPGPFVPERDCASGQICLTKILGEKGTLVLAVVANAIGFSTGVAFEFGFDPAVLRLRSATPGSAFTAPVVAYAAESAPGQLLAGIAERARNGARGKQIDSARTLWTLTFDVLSTERTEIRFAPGTGDVRSASNTPTAVGWVGGTLEAAPSNATISAAAGL